MNCLLAFFYRNTDVKPTHAVVCKSQNTNSPIIIGFLFSGLHQSHVRCTFQRCFSPPKNVTVGADGCVVFYSLPAPTLCSICRANVQVCRVVFDKINYKTVYISLNVTLTFVGSSDYLKVYISQFWSYLASLLWNKHDWQCMQQRAKKIAPHRHMPPTHQF